ncbi:MAG: T9SS type A sorting domain-containing protein, partial [Pyrinomonadaceae bacterium]|nr:T9SS type A sorting domain-containing protein [Sphingobacteriaceae bacterium]
LGLYHTGPLPLKAFSPSPANNVSVTTTTQANASWKGGINTTVYKVYLGTATNNLSYKADVAVNTPTYQFIGLNPNSTYFWRVDAVGPAGVTEGTVWSFKTPAPQGVVADWKLDATSGTAITDNSSYQMNGTLQNITDYVWEAGKVNNGLNLRTVNGNTVIRVPHKDNIAFDKNSFSVSMWVKASMPAVPANSAYLFHKGTFTKNTTTGATGKWYGVELKNGSISFNVDDDVNKSTITTSSTPFLNNTWMHIVFVRDVATKKLRIYRSGALIIEGNENTTSTVNGIGGIEPLNIANTNDLNSPYKGSLDEIKMFNYALSASEISGLALAKDAQTITFAAIEPKKVADADFDAAAVSTSGLAINYSSSNANVATIVNGKIHIVGAGSSTITATQPGNAAYIPAVPVVQVLSVSKRDQNITFNAISPKIIDDEDFDAAAVSSAGLALQYSSSDSTIASIVNGLIKINGSGSVVITASQNGNVVYNPAVSVSQTLVINKKDQSITFAEIAQKTMGDVDFDAAAVASSGLPVSYSSSDENVASVVNGLIKINAAGSVVITASQSGNTIYNSAESVSHTLVIIKKTQSISFNPITPKTIGDEDFDGGATTNSGLSLSYTSSDASVATIVDGKIHILASGTSIITAAQAGDTYYSAAEPVSQTLTVNKKTQTISFASIAGKIFGEPDFTISASAGSGLPVSFSSSNSAVATIENGTIHITGIGTTVIVATQAGNAIYSEASPISQTLEVGADVIAPTVPGNIAASVTDSVVTLSWTASSDFIGVSGYKIYKNGVEIGTTTSTTYRVNGLSSSVLYAFQVIAMDNAGNSSQPAAISVTTPDTQAPSIPLALTGDKTNKHNVALSWQVSTDNVGVIGYYVYRNGVLLSTLVSGNSYLAERPKGKDVYEFIVKAIDAAGNISLASNSVVSANGIIKDNALSSGNFEATLGTEALTIDPEGINAYPNPSQGNFKVSVSTKENGKITVAVFNTSGALVQSINDVKDGAYQKEINLNGVIAGTYVVRVNVGGFVQSKTIIIY